MWLRPVAELSFCGAVTRVAPTSLTVVPDVLFRASERGPADRNISYTLWGDT
jgi:hypothetical protein